LFYFVYVYEVHQPHSLTFLSFIHPPLFTSTSLTHTVPILKSCLSLLIPKSVFKGVSQCIPAVGVLYFGLFNSFHYSPLLLLSHSPLFNSFRYISLYHLPSQMLYILILLTIILFSFPSSPKFHRVSPLLQTCSICNFLYAHV
jgi:hypothetical protein